MIDKVTVIERPRDGLSDAAESILRDSLELAPSSVRGWERASIDVIGHPGTPVPVRPFLSRGDWMDDGQGNVWTVVTALLHEEDDNQGDAYLYHEYEVVKGMHQMA